LAAVVNGRSWPHVPPVTVHTGDTVRMRWINVTDRLHPMHLHGFYFRVESRGDMSRDTLYDASTRRQAVTELMTQGTTMSMSWVPERPGNWLMHCHMAEHMSPHLRGAAAAHPGGHAVNHSLDAMAGIVTGWHVVARENGQATGRDAARPRRTIRLLVQSGPARHGASPTLGFVLPEPGMTVPGDSVSIPGPPLVLTRGEPVEIMVVNRLDEPTSIHWHGIELDSYYDGVSGWSGMGRRLSPQIAPHDSFAVRFTPPRAGTFIYHSHFEEERQLASGMFGPLIVLEPGQRFDPDRDRTWVIGQLGPNREYRVLFNGSREPVVDMARSRTYRIRLINISPNIPLIVSVLDDSLPATWRAIAKDGADLPAHQATRRPAVQLIGVGETYDFEFTPPQRDSLRLTLRGPFGPVRAAGVIRVH
jgi:FtsP/CotA-like multicopper oxidase with cupredoxin domain